jgi:hypothetical protein
MVDYKNMSNENTSETDSDMDDDGDVEEEEFEVNPIEDFNEVIKEIEG